jgi:hypothetical protein
MKGLAMKNQEELYEELRALIDEHGYEEVVAALANLKDDNHTDEA